MRDETFLHWMKAHPLVIILSILCAADIFLALLYFGHPATLRVSFLDVGQGDAVFVEAPSGNQLLYDAGPPSGATLRALAEVMPLFDHTIDVAVLSHPDLDHIGGYPEVLKRYHIDAILESGATSDNGVYDTTSALITQEGAAHIIAREGMSIELGGGVVADVLYPDRDMSGRETNSASIVLRIRYGETAFLLSGDLPQNEEEILAQKFGAGLHATVLKLGHHGSRTSTSPYFIAAVSPDTTVISAGRDNRYGHPHKEVMELLEKLGISSLKTFEEGTITFASDGETITRI